MHAKWEGAMDAFVYLHLVHVKAAVYGHHVGIIANVKGTTIIPGYVLAGLGNDCCVERKYAGEV
jgi:hypothetical protein